MTMGIIFNDNDIKQIKQASKDRFWELVKAYIEQEIEKKKLGIISSISEDMSKTKWNDRDLEIFELQLLNEIKNIPERLITLAENQLDQ